ncbi:MAG: zinc-ribbon domain-containing protein [Pseudomonadota bacterium]
MKIECENCHAVYDVADSAIPPEGREVQCAKCDHVWFQMPVFAQPLDLATTTEVTSDPQAAVTHDEREVMATELDETGSAEQPTEFRSYRAEALPDASEPTEEATTSLSSEVADILDSEAEFSRQVRSQTEEPETGSSLEAIRRRVIEDNQPEQENTDADASEVETEAAMAEGETEETTIAEQPEDEVEPVEIADGEVIGTSEPNAFRRFAPASGKKEPSIETAIVDAVEIEDIEPTEVVETPPEEQPAVKRKRQSLAELSAVGAARVEVTTPPSEKPLDLGPVAPSERPETPGDQDVPVKMEDTVSSAPIAQPDMSPEKIAQKALDELDALDIKEEAERKSFAGGFAIGLLLIAILVLLYFVGPVLSEFVPGLGAVIEPFRAAVDSVIGALGIDFSAIGAVLRNWLEAI